MAEYKSETERAAEFQEKAISIRDYMQEPDTMRQLVAALPKWLRPDRFIRLFYSAMMQIPKLLLCTKQSLLSCMIQAAQIGIEPVFGKAVLIPFGTEVQLQLMYKGLMEIARRFADIIITGHVVYEIDEFDIVWGDNELIYHKPNFSPEREKSAKIGAYDIWKIGHEIRSRRFMPTSDILFIRDTYSKAWKKDGKQSVWGKHEDDMFLKTVIKGHCKLEPQCIEMERAVELDDRVELQRTQLGMGRIDELPMPSAFDFKVPDIEGTEQPEQPKGKAPDAPPPVDIAKTISAQSGLPVAAIREFISFIAKKQEKTEAWVEENAMKSPDSFIRAVNTRIATLKAASAVSKEKAPDANEAPAKPDMIEWLRVCRPSSSLDNAKEYIKVFKDQDSEIAMLSDRALRDQLIKKRKKTEDYIKQKTKTNGVGGAEQSNAEAAGADIRKNKEEETELLTRYDNSVESVMKFDKSGVKYTIADFESFMLEMAHMEGVEYSTFKADVMRSFQFPEYFDKFIARISGGDDV